MKEGKLNYSTAKHLAKMIIMQSEKLEEALKEVEEYRKGIFDLAKELRHLLEEAHRESDK